MIRLHPPSGPLHGEVILPYSKSMLNRQLVMTHLAGGVVAIDESDSRYSRDSRILSRALQAITNQQQEIDVRDAGTAMRFMTAVSAMTSGDWRLSGTDRMHLRPISPLVDALQSLGADIGFEHEGCPPLLISGHHLQGGKAHIRGDVSSQFISALLMIGGNMQNGLELQIEGPILSRPYIEMTVEVMTQYGLVSEWKDDNIRVASGRPIVSQLIPEGDWSAAAFWYAILAVAEEGELHLPALKMDSPQGDRACVDVFEHLGVSTTSTSTGIHIIATGASTDHLQVDCTDFPDMAQAIAFCCAAKGVSCHLTGLDTLPGKETDRIAAIRIELSKLGIDCRTTPNSLSFDAGAVQLGQSWPHKDRLTLSTYDDHRMAMAMSCLAVKGQITLDEEEVVAKSYPAFWEEMAKVGFGLEG